MLIGELLQDRPPSLESMQEQKMSITASESVMTLT